jgi:hypothetical protein
VTGLDSESREEADQSRKRPLHILPTQPQNELTSVEEQRSLMLGSADLVQVGRLGLRPLSYAAFRVGVPHARAAMNVRTSGTSYDPGPTAPLKLRAGHG